MSILRVGDKVRWRGCFGQEPAQVVVVTEMEVTEETDEKEGYHVEEVEWKLVRHRRVLFGLANGHWAYSRQIQPYFGKD